MAKGVASQALKKLGGVISKNSPTILTGLAVAGFITTVILAVKATPTAVDKIKADSRRNHDGDPYGYTKKEAVRSSWRCYIPTCGVGLASIICIVGANSVNLRRNAALASIYSITETAFKEYQSKVVETIGKNKETKVRDEISADRIRENPSSTAEIIYTGKGEVLCYDSLSGRYFKSDIESIRRSVNELNVELINDLFVSLNELYYRLGLGPIKLGDEMGWDIDQGVVEVIFSSQLSDVNEPCLVLNYRCAPKHRR